MIKIKAGIAKEPYRIEIKSSSGNTLIADEPLNAGGKDLGFSPKELLASALAACTAATLRMYADHKNWDLQEVKLEIELEQNDTRTKTSINRKLEFIGNLTEEQRTRLLAVANACPVHKILTNPVEISTAELKS
ncbi:MAG: osmotically inducible protein OsmC [Sphingobacteriales bacterium 17-39-43]|uniref:OsmC family protein n=1 Tax=Daejeonella sp. TaxID=2805397 RepID=UPI000BD8C028|nr:OsmC family protein [Daejeonella sp.]OYZ30786.1 MAG: osmotically inducible protein OsmC [Sphingobacteriales bacterium 16-39-50]OZA23594.1 MAG: osmotically inducible protein OsmC [Sphingobacteriales bacterium 17-39-43]HQS51867.1 OsmC family protein [Daejeonella sp.]HQT23790.1 OsmC family protein [Daejeonella sp.]HQT58457.1 OsmC family protein [Daejeonella sp.]